MKDPTLVVAGLLTLSAGTFAFRFAGPVLRQRIAFPPRAGNDCSRPPPWSCSPRWSPPPG